MLGIQYPIIMAPMFLVSNSKMVMEAIKFGATGAIPSLNYRTNEELETAILEIREKTSGPFGINLIVNRSNVKLDDHLKICVKHKVDFIITSLGSPAKVIEECHKHGMKVFCDVVDLKYAKKVESLGADGVIAVNSRAGGHAGPTDAKELISEIRKNCNIPIISAGGVANHSTYKEMMDMGADAVSVGSIFIASEESNVSDEYKQAIIDYGASDIVMTTKLSGTPCTVINTPYVQEIGTKQNFFERILNSNKTLKKFFKMITYVKGMKKLRNAAFSATYKTVWCAGPSIEHVNRIRPVKEILNELIGE